MRYPTPPEIDRLTERLTGLLGRVPNESRAINLVHELEWVDRPVPDLELLQRYRAIEACVNS
jgi:hypothetical protein